MICDDMNNRTYIHCYGQVKKGKPIEHSPPVFRFQGRAFLLFCFVFVFVIYCKKYFHQIFKGMVFLPFIDVDILLVSF